ncbi:LacI family DNA-binding transcriptional regulator [Pseudomonas sp. AA-38]|uniref:LacI family DNA-binding transcriptional regulator n=1 Tax=Pseudomonas sp. AA-38 TaxID=3028807 RepID=UPI0023F821D7|nr:LacI family DNA-binding transcriptional regulator [Pseudomonas sp. AA-38]
MGRSNSLARSARAPTLVDVAKVAGVSPITVSRALGRPELVTAVTRRRVLEAVRATGYVPNLAAGALASSRSRLVAVFLPTIANSIFADTVQALTERLAAAGYQTLLGLTGYCPEQEEALLEAVLGRRPDGIVLTGTEHTQTSRERLARVGIPVVEAWDLSAKPLDMQIGFSHEAVGQAVADYLLGKGYRRISVVTLDDPRGLRRYRSLEQALATQGVELLGMQILPAPATLAVMGFGDLSSAAHSHPPLTTISIDGPRIGTAIAEALLARIAEPTLARQPLRLDVGFEVVGRGSG